MYLVMLRVESLILPLLTTERYSTSIFWKKDVDPDEVKHILKSIIAEVHKEQSEKVATILQKPSLPISPNSKENKSFCPTLKHYGIPLDDRRLHEAFLRDFIALNKKYQRGYKKHMILYEGSTKGTFNLVPIPKAIDVEKIRRTAKDYKWVYNLLAALG
eukprot:CAMPEP_0195287468 /NCGR_PEP_ID=MMETSP0707-20130614/4517_1 /TAXON_ID=33640 /ORGANISM="Asterionellopsis glacialis, Strain CCMP134" /LENGTH=158 /DNA_ID=CAMNT_0040347225 /DNA_START=391 /DNA_END=863 /DNA_ORIENTATION=+